MFWLKSKDILRLQIVLLNSDQLEYECSKTSAKGKEVLDFVLSSLHVEEKEYFGLRYQSEDEQVYWLELGKSVRSQLKRCIQPYRFYFCVKFYPKEPYLIHDPNTREQIYIQVKQDIFQERLTVPRVEDLVQMGADALQVEMGDFDPNLHEPGYASETDFIPPSQSLQLAQRIEQQHKKLRGRSHMEAEYSFLERASRLDLYGADMHGMVGGDDGDFSLGLTPSGIVLVKDDEKVGEYPWINLAKISKDVSCFNFRRSNILRDGGGSVMLDIRHPHTNQIRNLGFRLATKEAARHFYKCTSEHLDFFKKTNKPQGARTPSISSRILSRLRSSSQKTEESDAGSLSSRKLNRIENTRQSTSRPPTTRDRLRSTVIYEDDNKTVVLEGDDTAKVYHKVPTSRTAETQPSDPRSLSLARPGIAPRRAESPLSLKSSFSTYPQHRHQPTTRVMDDIPDIDNDSVFSNSSRMSHVLSEGTLQKKRKRSQVGENNSSGASEETDAGIGRTTPRSSALRSSLGPQQRRRLRQQGPAQRYKTHDGSSMQEALLQIPSMQAPMSLSYFQDLSLPERLAFLIQPAKSMHQLSSAGMQLSQDHHGTSMGNLHTIKARTTNTRALYPVDVNPATSRTLPRTHRVPSVQEHPSESFLPLSLVPDDGHVMSEYSFDPTGRLRKLSRFDPRETLPSLPTSSPRFGHSMGKSLPSSPMKSRSFDFKVESGPPTATEPSKPVHVRSLSHSSESTPPGRSSKRLVARQRLKSDTAFVAGGSHDFQEDHGTSAESSPLTHPFPIIPPPTPFSGDDPEPPQVPARPPFTFTSRIGSKKSSLFPGTNRNESFSNAVGHGDIELQEMRPLKEAVPEPLYDAPYGSEGPSKQVVEVDVHPRRIPSVTNPIVHNQLYTDVTGLGEPRNKPEVLNNTRSLRQVPANTMTKLGLPSNSVILSHPLAVYSTGLETQKDLYGSVSTSKSSSRSSPGEDTESSLHTLHAIYANAGDCAMYTDI
ncbi:hypothetical protein RvY_09909 [Ramazzottius varieornatus]|uniref:FERM domain-containing protein n=1 Tax=Ramazzottius varieornatus TaxID=947166 RepID=A0A1D1VB04_RAMVA|nr:hypothetical protein RvY_09909 [Ramazzottius varieornatus]